MSGVYCLGGRCLLCEHEHNLFFSPLSMLLGAQGGLVASRRSYV